MNFLIILGILAIMLITILAIIYVELGERRVPISYSRKTIMQNQTKRVMNYIPVKVNLSGVIPPIFASAILMFPLTMLQSSTSEFATAIADSLAPGGMTFNVVTFFIPGVRPGEHTKEFLNEVASRLTGSGAVYLAIVSTIPFMVDTLGNVGL
jgi:preprotein translocase subunit SecY